MHRWQWASPTAACDIVQPDLHYGGGFIRATQVARMAAAAGMPVMPHMSGGGLGYLDVVHFASFTPNIGPFMEFKGNTDLPVALPDLVAQARKRHRPLPRRPRLRRHGRSRFRQTMPGRLAVTSANRASCIKSGTTDGDFAAKAANCLPPRWL